MKLITYSPSKEGHPRAGVIMGNIVIDLKRAYEAIYSGEPPDWFSDVGMLLRGGSEAVDLARRIASHSLNELPTEATHELDSITYYPPIPYPNKILCIASNYAEHSKELGGTISEEPYIFVKLQTSLIGHRWPIIPPKVTKKLDHEIELALVIGKRGKYIDRKDAFDFVAGFTIFNDISSRDFTFHKVERYKLNWLRVKSMDGSAPNGPWLVTKDEIADPHNLQLIQKVNGEVRQNGSTSEMTFKIPEIIEYISTGITLLPGDIISTGTPPGVGLATGKFLKDGDILDSQIEKIGTLTNEVHEER
jgi:2-keto-4-pentenoate hydratase/2-oxohepta-3-ene-1,7-dioic acid hydratase in catechol pathway